MPRLIPHTATGPIKIEPQDKPVFVCACGLSQSLPLCDGSHKACNDEAANKVYIYDADRKTVIDVRDADDA